MAQSQAHLGRLKFSITEPLTPGINTHVDSVWLAATGLAETKLVAAARATTTAEANIL